MVSTSKLSKPAIRKSTEISGRLSPRHANRTISTGSSMRKWNIGLPLLSWAICICGIPRGHEACLVALGGPMWTYHNQEGLVVRRVCARAMDLDEGTSHGGWLRLLTMDLYNVFENMRIFLQRI